MNFVRLALASVLAAALSIWPVAANPNYINRLTVFTAPSNNFLNGVDDHGNLLYTQPQFTNIGGVLGCSQLPIFTGDVTASSCALTLATVNSNVGTFGASNQCPIITIDGKGRITAASQVTCSGGAGSVTSVGLSLPSIFVVSGSPVTSAGTLSATLATQSANMIFAGPASGAAATPTFRAHVCADLPAGVRCLLNTLTASSSANLADTTSFGYAYDQYEIILENISPATNNDTLVLDVFEGGVWQSTGYGFAGEIANYAGVASLGSVTSYFQITKTSGASNVFTGISGFIRVMKPSNSGNEFNGHFGYYENSYFEKSSFSGNLPTGILTGFRVRFLGGNISSGSLKVYGFN